MFSVGLSAYGRCTQVRKLINLAGQGKRLDINSGMAVLKASGVDGMVRECPDLLVKYPRGFLLANERLRKPSKDFRAKEVFVLYGPTGTGKSYYALDHYPGHYRVPPPQRGSWWFDKYEGEEEVLLDEYASDPERIMPFGNLLELLDGYLIQVPYKGGYFWFKPKVIVITSNKHPRDWHPTCLWEALERRITHLFEYVGFRQRVIHKKPSGWSASEEASRAAALRTAASAAAASLDQEGPQEAQATGPPVPASQGDWATSPLHLLAGEEVERLLFSDELMPPYDE